MTQQDRHGNAREWETQEGWFSPNRILALMLFVAMALSLLYSRTM